MSYEAIIGLEVHAQLQTKSKMFCRCSTDNANALPNTHVCQVCLGMPGVLPTINQQAVEHTIMTALASNCAISEFTKFDRKNYPYPDLMKGYQISQYDTPIGREGWLAIEANGQEKKVGITRVHLEEDVAKLIHHTSPNGENYSLMDVNRSGVPLMEIVSEPDLRSPEEARQYLMKLRSILQYLNVSAANMEDGNFRCDANISVRPEGSPEFMTKVEIKNMNSFKAVYRALEYEVTRQIKAVEQGKRLVQETRGWMEEKGVTVAQRSKEYAHDYRYFPEPDLPPLVLGWDWVGKIRSRLPELPEARRDRFVVDYGLSLYNANLLTSSKAMADYFEDCLGTDEYNKLPKGKGTKEVSNWLLGHTSHIINANGSDVNEFRKRVSPEHLCGLIVFSHSSINTSIAKSVLGEMYDTANEAANIISQRGLSHISDTEEVAEVVSQVIQSNIEAVTDYKAGKEQALKFLIGQIMKATRGRASPQLANELLKKKLEEE
ncbi:Asp-tRNA(Asn)/Glu-tRNA(Gln) amidotransferase subunit GatB [Chloroflexota bacterium]